MHRYASALLLAVLIGAVACSTHQGIKPIEPEVGHYSPVVVASLAPKFRWQPLPEPDTLYDLAVFEVLDSGEAGQTVYYREALATPEHTVEESLRPDTNYYWSVRSRRGAAVGAWATYDHKLLVPIPFGFYYSGKSSLLFPFKTPVK